MGWLDVGSALVPTWPEQAARSRVPMEGSHSPSPPALASSRCHCLSLCPCELHTTSTCHSILGMLVMATEAVGATWHLHNRKMEQKVSLG